MDEAKHKRLEAAGWTMGDCGDFLGMSEAERQHVELRIALCAGIKRLRESMGINQKALAKLIGSTPARISKAETGTVEISLDLMFQAFFAAGGTPEELIRPRSSEPIAAEVAATKPTPKPRRMAAKQGG